MKTDLIGCAVRRKDNDLAVGTVRGVSFYVSAEWPIFVLLVESEGGQLNAVDHTEVVAVRSAT